MNYTRNITTRLRNKGFDLVIDTKQEQTLTKGKLNVYVLHESRTVLLTTESTTIINFTARELDALDKLLNQKS